MNTTSYLGQISSYNRRKACPIPERTALLVIDMQRYFKEVAEPILDNVRALIDTCRSSGIACIYTRHGHIDPAVDGGMLADWWGELIIRDSYEWLLLDDITPKENEIIIDKNRYSAFYETPLDEIFAENGVDEIIICGVLTNCCCETTARDAYVRDYRVFFVADATATINEDLHISSLKNLAYGFAHIVDTRVLCEYLHEGLQK